MIAFNLLLSIKLQLLLPLIHIVSIGLTGLFHHHEAPNVPNLISHFMFVALLVKVVKQTRPAKQALMF